MELEIDVVGNKISCQTATSVASVCRDLGGVYDALGVPNCLFALEDVDCSTVWPDGYVHDIVAGVPQCGNAKSDCPAGFFAIGINDGLLDCRPLARDVATVAAVTCEPLASVGGAGGATPTATCNCTAAGQNWNGTACAAPTFISTCMTVSACSPYPGTCPAYPNCGTLPGWTGGGPSTIPAGTWCISSGTSIVLCN